MRKTVYPSMANRRYAIFSERIMKVYVQDERRSYETIGRLSGEYQGV